MNGIVRDRYADWKNRFDLSPNVLLEKGIAVEDLVHGLDIVIHTCREAWLAGIMVGFNGNMSMRLGEDLLLVTGTTVPKGHLTDNDVALICVDGTRIAGPAISSETAMHTDVYKAVPDARFILHTHPTHLLALSVAVGPEEMLSMPLFESRMWKDKLAFADACAPGSRELARSVGEAAVKGQAVFMKEHGLCVYGKTAGEVLAVLPSMYPSRAEVAPMMRAMSLATLGFSAIQTIICLVLNLCCGCKVTN